MPSDTRGGVASRSHSHRIREDAGYLSASQAATPRSDPRVDALTEVVNQVKELNVQLKELKKELVASNKLLRESEASNRGLRNKCELLEEENLGLLSDKQKLKIDNTNLLHERAQHRDIIAELDATVQVSGAHTPTSSRGPAVRFDTSSKSGSRGSASSSNEGTTGNTSSGSNKLHRSDSTKQKHREKPRKEEPELIDTKRLAARLKPKSANGPPSHASSTSSSSRPPRVTPAPYMEEWGSKTARRPSISVPLSPGGSMHPNGYVMSDAAVTASMSTMGISSVPRSGAMAPPPPLGYGDHYAMQYPGQAEDGNYHPHPLSEKQKKR